MGDRKRDMDEPVNIDMPFEDALSVLLRKSMADEEADEDGDPTDDEIE